MGLIALLAGSTLAVYILFAVWEFALFKRVFDDPLKGKLTATFVAYCTAAGIAGFGMADGGPYVWRAFLIYLPGALIVAFFAYRRGQALRDSPEVDPALEETFR